MCEGAADSGQIALVPWDAEVFAFGVADYKIDSSDIGSHDSSWFSGHLEVWAKAHSVELIGTTAPASDTSKLYFFQSLGFRYIDTTLTVRYENVQKAAYLPAEVTLTPAVKDDLEAVMQICGEAFQNGRYHADARFPRHLANRRYQEWARRAFNSKGPQTLLVAKMGGQVCAFSVVQIDGEQGQLYLNAVAPRWQGKRIGIGLLTSTMHYLQEKGVCFVLSNISAANIRAVNLHSSLGARFCDPKIVLHWHAPRAAHLLTGGR